MQREFLQEKSLNRKQDNAEKSLNVDLSAKSRLIPYSTATDMLSLNDLYVEERDACETYRMIFTVNPICTNVLFNAITEPVYKEGSDDAVNIVQTDVTRNNRDIFPEGTMNETTTINQPQAVKDTEYSHERIGDFKYHCGYDIFNNHLLRTNEFEHVGKSDDNDSVFNTINDYAVDFSGKTVMRIVGESTGPFNGKIFDYKRDKIRMYALDTIKTFNAAFYDGLRVVDGWYGFYNSGYINLPNGKLRGKDISLNQILNNETPCGFIDMYPDRSLYSFIPKVNRAKKRLERNWDCTIVYPYKNNQNLFNTINENEANAVKVLSARVVYDNVGDEQIQMKSLFRHTLKEGDKIRLFYSSDGQSLTRYSVPVTVISVGDEKGRDTNRYFKIKLYDIRTFCSIVTDEETEERSLVINGGNDEIMFFYRKIENGCDDKYYFRKFKELKNYQYVECDPVSDAVEMKKQPSIVNENSPEYIKLEGAYFKLEGKPLAYTQNKIAFAENIYGDRVAQVIFTDDVCTAGLKDNLGRPLTSVYFMVVKTNRGHKEWYEQGIANTEDIEYSHCFGDVTSGLDLPMDEDAVDYNVRTLHNIVPEECADEDYKVGLSSILGLLPFSEISENGTPMAIETGITIDVNSDNYMNEFYGDVVEFSRVNFRETPIEKVYHRFNTAQRECLKNSKYFDVHYDELVGDIYDVNNGN